MIVIIIQNSYQLALLGGRFVHLYKKKGKNQVLFFSHLSGNSMKQNFSIAMIYVTCNFIGMLFKFKIYSILERDKCHESHSGVKIRLIKGQFPSKIGNSPERFTI